MTIAAAACYNNTGIELLSGGHHMDALQMFKEAARLVQSSARRSNSHSLQARHSETNFNTSTPPTQCSVQTSGNVSMAQQDYRSSDDQEMSDSSPGAMEALPTACEPPAGAGRCFIFSIPLAIQGDEASSTADAAVILYNIALTYHLLSFHNGQKQQARQHALKLYEMSYDMALQDLTNPTMSRVVMITLNNMGQIELERGNFQEACQCLDDLKEYIMALGEPTSQHVKIERNELLLNATLLRRPQQAPAA